MFVQAVQAISGRILSLAEVTKADDLIIKIYQVFEELYGDKDCAPNMHMHIHLKWTLQQHTRTMHTVADSVHLRMDSSTPQHTLQDACTMYYAHSGGFSPLENGLFNTKVGCLMSQPSSISIYR